MHPPLAGRPGTAARTVYWAEDDADDRFLIRQVLSGLASAPAVTFFEDGQALLDGLALARPDLVVLDNRMPRLGGIPALQAIRTHPALRDARDVPAIVFCGLRLPEEVAACIRLGVSSYVQKPSGFNAFAQAVRDILAQAMALDRPASPPEASATTLRHASATLNRGTPSARPWPRP